MKNKNILSVRPVESRITNYPPMLQIGDQTWAVKNLDVGKFRNGNFIEEARSSEEWEKAGEEEQPAWCYYNNDPANGKIYGKLYNWFAINDMRGLAPLGWRLPNLKEWKILTSFLGETAGTKIKANNKWFLITVDGEKMEGQGLIKTNECGFSALLSGGRGENGVFGLLGAYSGWWSSTEFDMDDAFSVFIQCNQKQLGTKVISKKCGWSVRCIKN